MTAISFQGIVDKLGFDPFHYLDTPPEGGWHEDDRDPNPLGVLTREELAFLDDLYRRTEMK